MEISSSIEKKANAASSLEAFSRCSLHGIKACVEKLLELIGRNGLFTEYTRHDISHINKLLEMLEWLVPPATFREMTVADCLMTTLAIYFHDLGMVVTKDEFKRRFESNFPEYKDQVSFAGPEGKDYRHKISMMSPDEAERFLYQEFVRHHHAERIRAWVMGKCPKHLGVADKIVTELEKVLGGLEDRFRRDLGIVCESHHRDDLSDLDKYKTSQPYGATAQEAANLQYCAVLLRTADLLHVTKDRAPSISFRTINPADPKSIEEWHKQMAVTSVRPKPGVDKEGNVDPAAPMNTIEVHGYFTEPEGFFALTTYLSYARKELRKSSDWVQLAKRKKGARYEFPWVEIDDSDLEAQGFIDRQFEFMLDQARILDLLTGHTLYNDTTVVLRELVQNGLDAIRLQWEGEMQFIDNGEVRVDWSSKERVLTIDDNGTGMTQQVIDRHFLRVGSSLYQEEEFRKQHPNFSAISRFGIGVLSTFMISDEVDITTCHPDETQARTLSLRSLHGKYLIRLIDKDAPELPPHILPHGTRVRLRVRSSAELQDPVSAIRRWIVFPRCKVTVTIDGSAPIVIGFVEPKDVLRHELVSAGWAMHEDSEAQPVQGSIKIEQHGKAGITLAYPVRWSEYFQEWEFLPPLRSDEQTKLLMGTCIEGVRVEAASPGFEDSRILAIANSEGGNAPKTNVARSGFEATPERKLLLRTLYDLYCEHIKAEVEALQRQRSFSATWALEEAVWLSAPLLHVGLEAREPVDATELRDACADIPCIALEENASRVAVSPKQLRARSCFWTIDSAFFSSAEALVKELPGGVGISNLAQSIGTGLLRLPVDPYISAPHRLSNLHDLAFQNREVDKIVIYRDQRRVDMRWRSVGDEPIWRHVLPPDARARRILRRFLDDAIRRRRRRHYDVVIAQREIERSGLREELGISSMGRIFVLPGSAYAKYTLHLLDGMAAQPQASHLGNLAVTLMALYFGHPIQDPLEFVRRHRTELRREYEGIEVREDPELISVLGSTDFTIFDPRAWVREAD